MKKHDEIKMEEVIELTRKELLNIGNNLKNFRKEIKLTQADVAFYIFSDKSLISALERGVYKNTTLFTLIKFCKFYNKTMLELIS